MQAVRQALGRYRVPLLLAGVVLLAIVATRIIGGLTAYQLKFEIPSANGLYPGSDVAIGGADVGTVQDISLAGGEALVTISVDAAHAPAYQTATVAVRPKSLLGEMYVDLTPGSGNPLPSGATIAPNHVQPPVQLQDVINSLNAPTRQKLQTLIVALGSGVAGQGTNTNQTFSYGRSDLDDLAGITSTLAARDQDLQEIIQSLAQVTTELSRSDRRQELAGMIQNSQTLLTSLSQEDAQIRTLLVEANSALTRSAGGLSGTAPDLNAILRQTPTLVAVANELTADLGNGLDVKLSGNQLQLYDQSMQATTIVFGGNSGTASQPEYATRIHIALPTSGPDSFNALVKLLLQEPPQ